MEVKVLRFAFLIVVTIALLEAFLLFNNGFYIQTSRVIAYHHRNHTINETSIPKDGQLNTSQPADGVNNRTLTNPAPAAKKFQASAKVAPRRNSPIQTREKVRKKPRPPSPPDDPEQVKKYYTKGTEVKYPFKYDGILYPNKTCDNDTFLIVMVPSAYSHVAQRLTIRQTWGGVAAGRHSWHGKNITHKVQFMFVHGVSKVAKEMSQIREESAKFDDILIGNFTDTYKNLTTKTLFMLKYVSERCPQAKYILKSDDDTFVNLPLLLDVLTERPLKRSIWGSLRNRSRTNHFSGKNMVPRELYPLNYNPPFAVGCAYLITTDVAHELFDTSQYIRPYDNEDVYVTGVLGKMVGVKHVRYKDYDWGIDSGRLDVCQFVLRKRITSSFLPARTMLSTWKSLRHHKPDCSNYKPPTRGHH